MALLLYGVTTCEDKAPDLPAGVSNTKVEWAELAGLRCFYSPNSDQAAGRARESALEFHRVVHAIFSCVDVIPFCFPTFVVDEDELASEIQQHATEYRDWLAKTHGMVQMEIRIQRRPPADAPRAKGVTSGTEYLRSRQERQGELDAAAAVLWQALSTMANDWRERTSSDGMRCFALVGRNSVSQFAEVLRSRVLPGDLNSRVSGPWPPTEFFQGKKSE